MSGDFPIFEAPFIPRAIKNPPSSAAISALATTAAQTVLAVGGLLWTTLTLNGAAAIIAANTAPGTIVIPAPGAGKIVFPVCALTLMHRPAAFTLSPSWTLRYAGFATSLFSLGTPVQTNIDSNAILVGLSSAGIAIQKSTNDYSNQAVCVSGNQPTLAGGAGSVYSVSIGYQIVTLP